MNPTTSEHVFVHQQQVCLSVMYSTARVLQARNKTICVFFLPASSKRVLASGCGVEVALVQWKKKMDCFPVRWAFWENHRSAYRSQPSKGFEGALTSRLLKSFHPSKRATSSRTREHLACLSPTATVQPRCCKPVVRVMPRSMGNVQSTNPQSTHMC